MKSTLRWAVSAIVVGLACGVALGFWEARPWRLEFSAAPPKTAAKEVAPDTTEAKVVIAETDFNFDRMESGTKKRHTFPIRNAGSRPLTVTFVSHTCKCTTVELDGKSVEPGESIVIQPGEEKAALLEWAAKVPPGPFRHGANFTTNDPTLARLELTVEGDIVSSTTLSPSQLIFRNARVDQPAKAEMVVMTYLEPEVQILSHKVVDENLAKKIEIAVEPVPKEAIADSKVKAAVKVTATYNAGGVLGPFVGALQLETNMKQAPHVEVPIFGTVKGDISLFGHGWTESNGLLRMDPATSAAGGQSRLSVSVRGEHAAATELRIESVKPPELKATLGDRKRLRDDLYQTPLVVEIPRGAKPMVRAGEDEGGEGEILLATTHPVTKEVRLRVVFTVKP